MHLFIIGDVRVYSDMELKTIEGTRATFHDGSWCDAKTKTAHIKGVGCISFDAPGESGRVTLPPLEFEGVSSLDVQKLYAHVAVLPGDGSSVIVHREGPRHAVSFITAVKDGAKLLLENERMAYPELVCGSARVALGVFAGSPAEYPRVRIEVPRGTSVRLKHAGTAEASIGDTHGEVDVTVDGAGSVAIGSVFMASFVILGSGDIRVRRASENVVALIDGSGKIEIEEGDLSMLEAGIKGAGEIRFGGKTVTAALDIIGHGRIEVGRVTGRTWKNVAGSGDIVINNEKN